MKKHGDWDDTIIILTSDHAEMMGDHRMLGKGGFFDGSYHIPLIIRDPRRKAAGRKVEAFTEAVDILPTTLELLGSDAPAHLDGRSLAPFLDGKEPAGWRDAAHWEFDFRSISKGKAEKHFGISSRQCNLAVIRTEKFKYVHFGGGLPPVLFDLAQRSGRDAQCRRRHRLPFGAARHGGAAVGLAGRASRPVAGAERTHRRRHIRRRFIRCPEMKKGPRRCGTGL